MRTVGIIVSHLSIGGAEKIAFIQSRIFLQENIRCFFICTDSFGIIGQDISGLGISVYDLSFIDRMPRSDAIRSILESERPEIIIVSNVFLDKNIFDSKVICYLHGNIDDASSFSSRILEHYAPFADAIIATHQRSYEQAVCKSKNVHLIRNPISRIFFERKRDPERGIIGYCGRISPEKSLLSILRTVAMARTQRPDLAVKIIGDADPVYPRCVAYRDSIEQEARRLALPLQITGFTLDPSIELATIEAGLFLSATEGFGMFPWESLAMGIPMLSLDVGAAYEVIEPVMMTRSVLSELDERQCFEMAARLVRLLENPRQILNHEVLWESHEDNYKRSLLNLLNI